MTSTSNYIINDDDELNLVKTSITRTSILADKKYLFLFVLFLLSTFVIVSFFFVIQLLGRVQRLETEVREIKLFLE